jgi:hypothetical protein
MLRRMIRPFVLLVLLLPAAPATAQTPSPEALSTAKELIETMHYTEHLTSVLAMMMKALKPTTVKKDPAKADLFDDVLMPAMSKAIQARLPKLTEEAALVYSRNFSGEDLKVLNAFYKTPAGQKLLQSPTIKEEVSSEDLKVLTAFYNSPAGQRLLQKSSTIKEELVAVGRKFNQEVFEAMEMEELRKKGVDP